MRFATLCRQGRSFADQRLAEFVIGHGQTRELRRRRRAAFLDGCFALPEKLGEARPPEVGAARLERVQRLGQSRRFAPLHGRLDRHEQGRGVLEVQIDERAEQRRAPQGRDVPQYLRFDHRSMLRGRGGENRSIVLRRLPQRWIAR